MIENKKMNNKVIDLFANNKVVPNKGVKYSTLLEQFISPFMDDFKEYDYLEDILTFAIHAWNFGNIKTIIPSEEFDKTRKDFPKMDIDVVLLNKMIDYKAEKFKEYEKFIVDFELEEVHNDDPTLSVITQEKEDYLTNMMDGIEEPLSFVDEDFEENYINRSAIIIKPKQPFIDWYNSLHSDSKIDEIDIDIYLVDGLKNEITKCLNNGFELKYQKRYMI